MKFMVTTQKHVVDEFEIEASCADEAAKFALNAAEGVVAPYVTRISTGIDGESIVILEVVIVELSSKAQIPS